MGEHSIDRTCGSCGTLYQFPAHFICRQCGNVIDMRPDIATLTRERDEWREQARINYDLFISAQTDYSRCESERDEAIERAEKAESELGETRKYVIEQGRRQSKLELDVDHFKGVAKVQNQRADRAEAQLAETRKDAERLKAALREIITFGESEYGGTCAEVAREVLRGEG